MKFYSQNKNFFKKTNWLNSFYLLILPILALGLYTFLLLVLNVDKGFDITDESFYILNSTQPENVILSVTSFGFYTNLLYQLSGEQLAILRLLGVLLLLLTTLFFSTELYKYVVNLTNRKKSFGESLLFSFPIMIGSLAYYASWLLTPSYNWLALVGVIIFSTGLLRHVNNYKAKGWFDFSSVLVAFGGCITFFAKPTSAIILALLVAIWLIAHFRYIRHKIFFSIVSISVFVIVNFHILTFEKGYENYYYKIINGLELTKLLNGGHSFGNLIKRSFDIIPETIGGSYIYTLAGSKFVFIILFFAISILALLRVLKNSAFKVLILNIVLSLSILIYAGVIYKEDLAIKFLWIFIIELSVFLFLWVIIIKLTKFRKQNNADKLRKFIFLAIFLNLLNFAYVFGTINNMQSAMSYGAVFSFASFVILGSWFKNNKIILLAINIIAVLYIFVVINNAYERPYRLVENISSQTIKVGLLREDKDKDYIKVDIATAKYINSLQDIALENGWEQGNILIDMTGGSPGANVILDADFIGTPWLLGGYLGSKEFATFALSKGNFDALITAWVLTAPNGSRKLPEELLNDVGFNFPDAYEIVGSTRTGHRNETQFLWKRKSAIK